MSATVIVAGVVVERGPRTVLADVDLTVAPGDRLGVVGPNGVGKSTLLAVLAGQLAPDLGQVVLAPPTATVGLLPQETDRTPGETLRAFLARRTGCAAADAALEVATQALTDGAPGADDAYALAFDRWLALGAADLDVRAEQVCADLGLTVDLDAAVTGLSGGQAARASLASVLLSQHDVLLLDEPTNDLDFAGLERLERFVLERSGALVVVSHDREFLARTISGVVEVDQHTHSLRRFDGGYTSYLTERARARQQARDQFETYDDKREALVDQAQKQREQAVRGALRAKNKRKDNDKVGAGARLESATHAASRVKAVESRMKQLEVVEEPRKEWDLRMEIAAAPRSGGLVATLQAAVVELGSFRLGPVDLEIGYGDRVVLTGPNGAGKSTLLGALLGTVPLVSGSQRLGSGVAVGSVDQARTAFRGQESATLVLETATGWAPAESRTLLAKFGLRGDRALQPASTLSPGERTRAGLAMLQAVGVNCLVLDEPTNHLDTPAIEQLEQALETYPGTLLLVTHDRRMLEAVRATRQVRVAEGRVTEV